MNRWMRLALTGVRVGRLVYRELRAEEPRRLDEVMGELRAVERLDDLEGTLARLREAKRRAGD